MEQLEDAYSQATTFPSNLLCSDVPTLYLNSTRDELQSQASRLFCEDEADAAVDIFQRGRIEEEAKLRCIQNSDDLKKTLWMPLYTQTMDPVLRMVFFTAPSSRDKLNITLDMAQKTFTYLQVMPQFLDSIYAFGFREHSEDSFMTSYRSRNFSSQARLGLEVSSLGRSGRLIEHCYGLRSVERSSAQQEWPWSARLCSIYHSFDLESGQANWIVVKANKLIEKLVRDANEPTGARRSLDTKTMSNSLNEALRTHGLVAYWCGDNWQWYISFLETQLQAITRPALATTMEPEIMPLMDRPFTDEPSTMCATPVARSVDEYGEKPVALRRIQSSFRSISSRMPTFRERALPATSTQPARQMTVAGHEFSFKDLPRVHYIEEKANETLDILQNNDEILESLRNDYKLIHGTLKDSEDSQIAFAQFFQRIETVQKDLRKQRTRVEKLLRLLRDRKSLLEGILSFANMQANQRLAEKANKSAENMEIIAQDTKRETISMRVITLVTLFFLPGTFISTLMSTPIITFESGSPDIDGKISRGALGFFVAISMPLVALTFIAWLLVYWWEKRKERQRQIKANLLPV